MNEYRHEWELYDFVRTIVDNIFRYLNKHCVPRSQEADLPGYVNIYMVRSLVFMCLCVCLSVCLCVCVFVCIRISHFFPPTSSWFAGLASPLPASLQLTVLVWREHLFKPIATQVSAPTSRDRHTRVAFFMPCSFTHCAVVLCCAAWPARTTRLLCVLLECVLLECLLLECSLLECLLLLTRCSSLNCLQCPCSPSTNPSLPFPLFLTNHVLSSAGRQCT